MNKEDYKVIGEIITAYLCKYVCRDKRIRKLRDGILTELANYFEKEEVGLSIKESPKDDCLECGGDGVLLSLNSDRDHLEVQRCDNCGRFEGDLEAWEYVRPIFKERIFNRKQFLKDTGVNQ